MLTMTANEAKTNFGDTLMKAQRTPVQITKSGKPVAVMMSMEEYQASEELKLLYVKEALAQAEEDIKAGRVEDVDALFDSLSEEYFHHKYIARKLKEAEERAADPDATWHSLDEVMRSVRSRLS